MKTPTAVPLLSPSSLDFPGCDYRTSLLLESNGDRSAHVVHASHSLEGDNFVSHLVRQGEAEFVTEVSSPASAFREAFRAEEERVTSTKQSIEISSGLLSPPLWSRLLVIACMNESKSIALDANSGTHEIWHGTQIEIVNGTILGVSDFYRTSGMTSLIRLSENKLLKEGSFKVEASETEGFYLEVQAHPRLYSWLKNPGEHMAQRQSILTCALAKGLDIILEQYVRVESPSWGSYPVLHELNEHLKERNLPSLETEEFDAYEVATQLKPIEFEEQPE